jgi:hypothetical protein
MQVVIKHILLLTYLISAYSLDMHNSEIVLHTSAKTLYLRLTLGTLQFEVTPCLTLLKSPPQ